MSNALVKLIYELIYELVSRAEFLKDKLSPKFAKIAKVSARENLYV